MRADLLVLAFALSACASPPPASTPATTATAPSVFPDDAALLALIKARVDDGRAAGIVLGVMDADGSTRVVAYGDPGSGAQPLSANSIFEIGSISKVFTATALADMAQKGEVKLDDPVQLYAPAGLNMPARNGKQITLRSLAEQNSGLPRLPANLKPADMSNPYVDYHAAQLNAFMSGYTLTRDPGELYEYSNLGVGLLGYVLAAKAGVTYEDLIAQRILKPLGMTMTGQKLTPQMEAALAKGHGAVVPLWDQDVLAGAGALRSNMTDMLKFLDANLGPPTNDLERAMRLAQTPSATARGPKIGLNWHTEVTRSGAEIVWHNGGTGGYGTYIGLDQKRGVGVVLLANTSGVPQDIAIHLLDPASPLTPKPAPPVQRTEIAAPIETLTKFTGVYAMDDTPTFELTITVENGILIVFPTGQGKIPAFPEAEIPGGGLKVFHKEVDAQITFTPAEDDKPADLLLHQNGRSMRFTKLR